MMYLTVHSSQPSLAKSLQIGCHFMLQAIQPLGAQFLQACWQK